MTGDAQPPQLHLAKPPADPEPAPAPAQAQPLDATQLAVEVVLEKVERLLESLLARLRRYRAGRKPLGG